MGAECTGMVRCLALTRIRKRRPSSRQSPDKLRRSPGQANEFAATSTRSPPARTVRHGTVPRHRPTLVHGRVIFPLRKAQPRAGDGSPFSREERAGRGRTRAKRMDSPLERREVRLRGLSVTGGGHATGPPPCTDWFSPLSARKERGGPGEGRAAPGAIPPPRDEGLPSPTQFVGEGSGMGGAPLPAQSNLPEMKVAEPSLRARVLTSPRAAGEVAR
jgi:hypothetical protein